MDVDRVGTEAMFRGFFLTCEIAYFRHGPGQEPTMRVTIGKSLLDATISTLETTSGNE